MKKTKINFEDIKAGDLIEVVNKSDGVKRVETGIAFTKQEDYMSGYAAWLTSEMGLLTLEGDINDSLSRIDVSDVRFDDIEKGDKIKVVEQIGNVTRVVEGVATAKVNNTINPYWVDESNHLLAYKIPHPDGTQTIEILEAGK